MKKTLFLGLILFGVILYSSCQQDEEIYSCNKEINQWVHDNINDIKNMSRSTWNDLDESVKRATLRAFTPQQKNEFWKDKLNEVLQMEWNEEEKAHLLIILNFINENPHIFDKSIERTDEEQENMDIFFYNWVEEAKSQLNWDMKLISGIVATGNTLIDKDGTIRLTQTSRALVKTSGESECECEQAQFIAWCLTSDCEESRSGCEYLVGECGFLGLYDCDGTCGGI